MSEYFLCLLFPDQHKSETITSPFLTADSNPNSHSQVYQIISDLDCNFSLIPNEQIIFVIRKLKANYRWLTRSIKNSNVNIDANYISISQITDIQFQSLLSDEVVKFNYTHDPNIDQISLHMISDGLTYKLSFTTTKITFFGKDIPSMITLGKNIPSMTTFGKDISSMTTVGKDIPSMTTLGKDISSMTTLNKDIPSMTTLDKNINMYSHPIFTIMSIV